ncbi:DUF6716 putative glycosyltransferase [Paramicrobacterium agarici]|uniref:Uncharacterized protein n=1 Tax=Paramicrobacterium agarici TaxID=630514 RepID=A0A2A9E044_9MICO|nr:DUF6716 putative glycosyltransferase [Microbacterium agarici]PFG32006.1 hypothetical protein ATJ78_2990 [Microbacterium agarici]
MSTGTRRMLVIADSDSYLKWGAAFAEQRDASWSAALVLLKSPVLPSARQLDAALAGTRFTRGDTRSIDLDDLTALIETERPHVVLLALRGPLVRVVAPLIAELPGRPVIVSGLPGLTIPAEPKAIVYREQCDMIVLHSRREVREFSANAASLGIEMRFALATLPFLEAREQRARTDARSIVFAVQAKVPAAREERVQLLQILSTAARAHTGKRVVVKTRARRGEAQTHLEQYDLAALLDTPDVVDAIGGVPDNLVVSDGPMAEHLSRAAALVTVSSTAALEAIAAGVPVLLLDDFGIGPRQINTVFVGSDLFGNASDLARGAWRHPDSAWLDDNYFHPAHATTVDDRLDELVRRNAARPLPFPERRFNLTGGTLRRAFERKRMLGHYDRSLSGTLSLVVALPARAAVRRARRLARMLRGDQQHPALFTSAAVSTSPGAHEFGDSRPVG